MGAKTRNTAIIAMAAALPGMLEVDLAKASLPENPDQALITREFPQAAPFDHDPELTLVLFKDQDAVQALAEIVLSGSLRQQTAAAWTLGTMGEEALEAFPALVNVVYDQEGLPPCQLDHACRWAISQIDADYLLPEKRFIDPQRGEVFVSYILHPIAIKKLELIKLLTAIERF